MTLVDTNVLIDILTHDGVWFDWSFEKLVARRELGDLLINEITYAELAAGIDDERQLERIVVELGVILEHIPRPALYAAGRTFGRYRAAGGPRTSLIPDFFIGAHAEVAGMPILTRDARRFRTYFPDVKLIAPE